MTPEYILRKSLCRPAHCSDADIETRARRMSTLELTKAIGQQADCMIPCSRGQSLTIAVRIIDARSAWNRTDYLVTPIAGSGQVWVSSERVKIQSEVALGSALVAELERIVDAE
jgi:hypothetical protein